MRYKNDDLSPSDRKWTCPGFETHCLSRLETCKNVRAEGLTIVAEGTPGDGKRLWTAVWLNENRSRLLLLEQSNGSPV